MNMAPLYLLRQPHLIFRAGLSSFCLAKRMTMAGHSSCVMRQPHKLMAMGGCPGAMSKAGLSCSSVRDFVLMNRTRTRTRANLSSSFFLQNNGGNSQDSPKNGGNGQDPPKSGPENDKKTGNQASPNNGGNSQDPPKNGENGQDPPKVLSRLKKWYKEFPFRFSVTALGAFATFGYLVVYCIISSQEISLSMSDKLKVYWAASNFYQSKIPAMKTELHIDRGKLSEGIRDEKMHFPWKTTLVVGIRGAGKSTAVLKAFKNANNVLLSSTAETPKSGYVEILRSLGVKVTEADARLILQAALYYNKRNGKEEPVMIFDVDESWSSADLRELILNAKKWSADLHLAKIIIIISRAHYSLKLGIGFDELRCRLYEVGLASEDDIKEYIKKNFGSLKNKDEKVSILSEKEVNQLIEIISKNGNLTFLDLSSIYEICKCSSCFTEMNDDIKNFFNDKLQVEMDAVALFFEYIKRSTNEKKALEVIKLFASKEKVSKSEIRKIIDMSDLVDACCKCRPHPITFWKDFAIVPTKRKFHAFKRVYEVKKEGK